MPYYVGRACVLACDRFLHLSVAGRGVRYARHRLLKRQQAVVQRIYTYTHIRKHSKCCRVIYVTAAMFRVCVCIVYTRTVRAYKS